MAKEELMQFDGLVIEILPDARYRVQLDQGHEIVAYTAGKMKKNRIKTLAGDRVTVEMSPYDLEKGRLVFRHKDERSSGPRPPVRGGQFQPRPPAHAQGPADRAHDAQRSPDTLAARRAPDRERDLPDPRLALGRRRGTGPEPLHPEHGQVRRRVPPEQACIASTTVPGPDGEVLVALDRVARRQHEAVGVDHPARRTPTPPVDPCHRRLDLRYRIRQPVRQRAQHAFRTLHLRLLVRLSWAECTLRHDREHRFFV